MGRLFVGLIVAAQCGLLAPGIVEAEEAVPVFKESMATPEDEIAIEPIRISMDFEGASLKRVLKTIAKQTGINIIAASDVAQIPVTTYLEEVTVLDALDQILGSENLTYERPRGSDIYIVRSKEEVGEVSTMTRIYRLKYARVSESVMARAATVFGSQTPFEASLGTVGEEEEGEAGGGAEQEGAGIDIIIQELLTDHGYLVVDGRTNSLIVTDVPENFPRIEMALVALDVRTAQILVDAEIIETTLTKLKDLGVEWGTGTEGDLATFTPSSVGKQTRFPFNLLPDRFGPGFRAEDAEDDNVLVSTASAGGFPTSTLSFGSFAGVLQALETDTDTKILARPKVLTLDNESALIRLTSDEAIGFETSSQSTTGTQASRPERETTGVVLVVTPQINDNNYITMIVEPSVTKTVASQVSPPSGQSTPRDPKTRSVRSLVRVRSGDTLVVGGLIDRSDATTLRRVPVLGDIPFLGKAFRNTEINDTASELIVFVTPHVLREPDEAQVASAASPSSSRAREQEGSLSRQELIEQTLNRLE